MEEIQTCEILVDSGSVNVPIDVIREYERKATQLKIIEKLYRSDIETYRYDEILSLIFSEKGTDKNAK